MSAPNLVNRHELLQWANTITASSELPRLVRRLILETGPGVVQLGFPAGEGVRAGDWDGTLRTTEQALNIPLGLSVWELSVERSPGAKADRDYGKRSTTPDGSPTSSCTYVEVILRPWTDRQKWARDRTAEGKWKAVRALGVDEIETWLEHAPVTHAWISQVLGHNPYGLRPIDLWWDTWSAATTPDLNPSFILAGRKEIKDQLLTRLQGSAQVTTITGGSLEEIQGLIAAAILQAEVSGDDQLKARTAFVDDLVTWRELLARTSPLILVAASEQLRSEPTPSSSAHHIIIPLVDSADADLEIPPLDPAEATVALKQSGIEDQRADHLARLARRSLLAMRREIASKPGLHQPPWARPPIDRLIRSLLLAGRWHEGRDGDKEVLSALSGMQYDELHEAAAGLLHEADPLLGRVDPVWALVSSHDAWSLLAKQVRADDLGRLSPLVQEVLGEVDPGLDLPKDERWWRASMEGKVHKYSSALRKGLAATLALLGVYGDAVDAGHGKNGQNWASDEIADLLNRANADSSCKLWISLSDVLPTLAEAAPDKFLAAVDQGLNGKAPVLLGFFEAEVDSPFGSSAPHTGLLWALEATVWSSQHFGRSADLLAHLAEMDPGGRLSNRPAASLASIFNPWHPDNTVDATRRLVVLDSMRERYPDVAWELMVTMLPVAHGIHFPIHAPTYRGWKPDKITVTNVEYFKVVTEVVTRLVRDATNNLTRWTTLVDKMANLTPTDRETVLSALQQRVSADDFSDEDKSKLWESLRSVTAQHREYSDAPWALPPAELEKIDNLQGLLQPDSPMERQLWLFQEYTPPIEGQSISRDYQAYEAAVAEARKNAAAEIDRSERFEGLLRLAREATQTYWAGAAIADATTARYERELVSLLGSEDRVEADLGASYVARRFEHEGWPWIEELLTNPNGLSDAQRAILLLMTRDHPKSWKRADELGADVARQFWSRFQPWGLGDFPHTLYAAERLMQAGRHTASLDLIQLYINRESVNVEALLNLAASNLEMLQEDDPDIGLLRQTSFEEFFNRFYDHESALGWDRVARLEWTYLPALGHDAHPRMLGKLLASDPDVFVDVLSAAYPPASDKSPSNLSKDEQNRAMNAYRLLNEWSIPPGAGEDGQIEGDALTDWVSRALLGLERADRVKTGTRLIGRVLAKAQGDPDGNWPCRAIRDLYQGQRSEHMENGFFIEVLNSRGVTSRSPDAGGDLERTEAARYRRFAEHYDDQWHRTAALLRSLADYYERDARGEDNSAERIRRGMDE